MAPAALLAALLAALFVCAPPASAQPREDSQRLELELLQKRNSLLGVIDAMRRTRADLEALQLELEGDRARGRQEEIVAEIHGLSRKLTELERNLSEISSGVDPRSFDEKREEQIDFGSELRDLLGPLVHELRRMTSRPREIDRLRSEISDSAEQLLIVDRAIEEVGRLREEIEDPVVSEALREEEQAWEARRQVARTTLSVSQQKLQSKEKERTSISSAVQNLFQLFFKSRGRNLLLALLVTITFLLLLRGLHRELQKRGPLSRAPSFRARLFNLTYVGFTVVGGVLVFLIVLYMFGDWVLLILMIMLLMGLVWASKQALPAFWSQVTLLLNMGVVREGERVVYQGIPFEVESLGFYTQLVNPRLAGGVVRLPINDLTALRSRPYQQDEPWFPTRAGDWVMLSDGSVGVVVQQTLDVVRVERKGGAVQVFPTADFPAQAPVVLSEGFRVSVTFGVDYQHVQEATGDVTRKLHAHVTDALAASRHAERVRKVNVEFASAAASSLDLVLMCDFWGEAAADYDELKRLVNRVAVDACNEYGWVIPFQQLTLHVAPAAASGELPAQHALRSTP